MGTYHIMFWGKISLHGVMEYFMGNHQDFFETMADFHVPKNAFCR